MVLVSNALPQAHVTVAVSYLGWISAFIISPFRYVITCVTRTLTVNYTTIDSRLATTCAKFAPFTYLPDKRSVIDGLFRAAKLAEPIILYSNYGVLLLINVLDFDEYTY